MNIHILGCYAATPTAIHNPTSQVLEIRNHIFLMDCGEGTQTALRKKKIRFSRINHIFISHLHGDHCNGIFGLIATFSLLKRKTELHLYGPKGLKELVLTQIRITQSYTGFELIFHELTSNKSELVFEDKNISVQTIPLQHRVYCNGFLFKEKPKPRTLVLQNVMQYPIDKCYYNSIKEGKDITLEDGRVIPNKELTTDPPPTKSYAYCSDTSYSEKILDIIKSATVLYHESTFLEAHKHLCEMTGHSTAKQAASIALKANVDTLLLGHYSTRYKTNEDFQKEAKEIFENTQLCDDGLSFYF